jgi:acyl-CoA dehydrogenase
VRLGEAVESLERATRWLLARPHEQAALAGATPYLRLFAGATGGALLAEEALAAMRLAGDGADPAGRIALARFFAENVAVAARGLERTVTEGAESVTGADAALAD